MQRYRGRVAPKPRPNVDVRRCERCVVAAPDLPGKRNNRPSRPRSIARFLLSLNADSVCVPSFATLLRAPR
eukprot:5296923-Lingulodinium_polyedra.AAC.1